MPIGFRTTGPWWHYLLFSLIISCHQSSDPSSFPENRQIHIPVNSLNHEMVIQLHPIELIELPMLSHVPCTACGVISFNKYILNLLSICLNSCRRKIFFKPYQNISTVKSKSPEKNTDNREKLTSKFCQKSCFN